MSVDDPVRGAVAAGAVVAFSLSGGKDSTAAAHAAMKQLDAWGHPRDRRVAIHADLGRAEWKATPGTVEAVAAILGLRLMVVAHKTHDMVSRWEARGREGLRRYAELEVFNLIGPWSSPALRFCTAEMKQQVIAPALLREFPGQLIVSVVGIRRDESRARSLAPVSKPEPRWARQNGSTMLTWHPIVTWPTPEVFAYHDRHGLPLHVAYREFGSSRVSCALCVMSNESDLASATSCASNRDLYVHLCELEMSSTFSFQGARWLIDVAPHLLSEDQREKAPAAKARAAERRHLEAGLAPGLRYAKGWPLRVPTASEAVDVAAARRAILAHHGMTDRFGSPQAIIERFSELMDAKPVALAA